MESKDGRWCGTSLRCANEIEEKGQPKRLEDEEKLKKKIERTNSLVH